VTTSIENAEPRGDAAAASPGPQESVVESQIPVRELSPAPPDGVSERLLKDATARDWLGSNSDPDVLLSVPHLGVDEITFELRDLRAHVNLEAQVLDLVRLQVGADVSLGQVNLRIAGVRAQAMLKVRLDNVVTIVDGVVGLLNDHPEIVTALTSGVGDAIREVGSGVGSAVHEIGAGTGDAVREVGSGLGGALDRDRSVERRHAVSYQTPADSAPPAVTTEPVEPVDAAHPVDRVEPVDPGHPVDPVEPVDPAAAAEPVTGEQVEVYRSKPAPEPPSPPSSTEP
jgi:hypothetical protein